MRQDVEHTRNARQSLISVSDINLNSICTSAFARIVHFAQSIIVKSAANQIADPLSVSRGKALLSFTFAFHILPTSQIRV